jgi:hypothetical protein
MHKFRPRRTRSDRGGPRKRLSYANVTATLALVFALGGGTAWAAHHYLIVSTNQIKPSVLKKLHGAKGANGANGINGTDGTNGTNGTNGAAGAAGPAGPNGAVAGYFAQTSVTTAFTGGTGVSILTKNLPAGNYVLNGNETFLAASTSAATQFEVSCTLSDSAAGTPTDTGVFEGLTNFIVIIIPTNSNSVSMTLAINTTAPSTAKIACSDVSNGGNSYQVNNANAALSAIQTTTNS